MINEFIYHLFKSILIFIVCNIVLDKIKKEDNYLKVIFFFAT